MLRALAIIIGALSVAGTAREYFFENFSNPCLRISAIFLDKVLIGSIVGTWRQNKAIYSFHFLYSVCLLPFGTSLQNHILKIKFCQDFFLLHESLIVSLSLKYLPKYPPALKSYVSVERSSITVLSLKIRQ